MTKLDRTERTAALEGIGLGIGLTLIGILIIAGVVIAQPGAGWRLGLSITGLVSCGTGLGGLCLDLSKLRDRPSLLDIGTAFVLLGLTAALFTALVLSRASRWVDVLLWTGVALAGFFGVVGLCMGLAKYAGEATEIEEALNTKLKGGRRGAASKAVAARRRSLTKYEMWSVWIAVAGMVVTSVMTVVGALIERGSL